MRYAQQGPLPCFVPGWAKLIWRSSNLKLSPKFRAVQVMANCVWIRCGIPCAAIRASKKSSPPSHQRNDAEAPRRLSPAILNLACLQSGRLHKREAIAIADHVLAFEPTDPYAPRGKSERLLGNGRSQSS